MPLGIGISAQLMARIIVYGTYMCVVSSEALEEAGGRAAHPRQHNINMSACKSTQSYASTTSGQSSNCDPVFDCMGTWQVLVNKQGLH